MKTIDRMNIDYQGNTEPFDAPEASTWFNTVDEKLYVKIGGIWVKHLVGNKDSAEEAYDRAMDIL